MGEILPFPIFFRGKNVIFPKWRNLKMMIFIVKNNGYISILKFGFIPYTHGLPRVWKHDWSRFKWLVVIQGFQVRRTAPETQCDRLSISILMAQRTNCTFSVHRTSPWLGEVRSSIWMPCEVRIVRLRIATSVWTPGRCSSAVRQSVFWKFSPAHQTALGRTAQEADPIYIISPSIISPKAC